MSKFKIGDIVTGKHKNHWVYGSKWRIKNIKSGLPYKRPTLGDCDLYEVECVDGSYNPNMGAIWLESELELVEEGQSLTQQDTFKIKDIIDKLNIKKGKYVSDNGVEIEITEDMVILSNKHNEEFVIPIDFDDTFKEDRKLTLDDFDLEEEFKILDCEGVFKKVKIFDNICIARKLKNGLVCTYSQGSYFTKEGDVLIKINK